MPLSSTFHFEIDVGLKSRRTEALLSTTKTCIRQGVRAKGELCQFSRDGFYIIMPNAQKILQSWMVYSPVSKSLCCFSCPLFTINVTEVTSQFATGFQAWWKLSPKLQATKISRTTSTASENELENSGNTAKTVQDQWRWKWENRGNKERWRDVMHRLLSITLSFKAVSSIL